MRTRITCGPLGIARHLRAQQIELGHASRLALLPHLVGGSLCLRERLFGDHDQAIGQHASKYAWETSSASCARVEVSASAAFSRPSRACACWACSRPPV